MKILLISVNNGDEDQTSFPNLGLGYIATYAQKHINDIEIKIINTNYESEVECFNPDIIGLSCTTSNYNRAIDLAKKIKRKDRIIMVGGTHISTLMDSFNNIFDLAIIGEGEITFTEFLQRKIQLGNEKVSYDNYKDIPGLLFKGLKYTGDRELIKDLDDIPHLDRNLIKTNDMLTTRGCPYRCVFCATSRFWSTLRFHSAKYIVDEIEELYNKHSAKKIIFLDDLFTINISRIKEIINLLEKRGLLGKIEYNINCRANTVNHELAMLLKKLGVRSVFLGLESGSPRILKYLKGDSVTVEMNKNAVDILSSAGIECSAAFIIGSPTDTKETINETYNFIKTLNVEQIDVFILTPFPGTPVWDYAKSKELVSSDMDFTRLQLTNDEHKVFICKNLTRKELRKELERFLFLKKVILIKNLLKVLIFRPGLFSRRVIRKIGFYIKKARIGIQKRNARTGKYILWTLVWKIWKD